MAREFQVGDVVRLTGEFLRNTGQVTGGEGQSKWTVLAVLPKHDWVVVDQEISDLGMFTPAELKADPMLRFRHFNKHNLQLVKR